MKPPKPLVEKLPSGKWRARVRHDGRRFKLGLFTTDVEAWAVARAACKQIREGLKAPGGNTFGGICREYLAFREAQGYRGIDAWASRLKVHVETDILANEPAARIDVFRARDFRDRLLAKRAIDLKADRTISRETVKQILLLVKFAFALQIERRKLASNPFEGVKLPRGPRSKTVKQQSGTWLEPAEIQRFLACKELDERDRIGPILVADFALRPGEAAFARLENLQFGSRDGQDFAQLHIVDGSAAGGTKSGKSRYAYIAGEGVLRLRRWLELLKGAKNFGGWLFPTRRGNHRDSTRLFPMLKQQLARAGITRRVRNYDLRHTGATTKLVVEGQGIEAVQAQLGHADARTTRAYLHSTNLLAQRGALEGAAKAAHVGNFEIQTPVKQDHSAQVDGSTSEAPAVGHDAPGSLSWNDRGQKSADLLRRIADGQALDDAFVEAWALSVLDELVTHPIGRLALDVLRGGPQRRLRVARLAAELVSLADAKTETA